MRGHAIVPPVIRADARRVNNSAFWGERREGQCETLPFFYKGEDYDGNEN